MGLFGTVHYSVERRYDEDTQFRVRMLIQVLLECYLRWKDVQRNTTAPFQRRLYFLVRLSFSHGLV